MGLNVSGATGEYTSRNHVENVNGVTGEDIHEEVLYQTDAVLETTRPEDPMALYKVAVYIV